MEMRSNELGKESSLYLQQHANNPVEWQAYSSKVFEMAKAENKMILFSIGYSACHWCHVMEHECFENNEVAEIMNRHFINVKVDREERPDVDQVYMTAVQLMTNSGGWPLNCFTLPDGRPIYGGTYFPKDQWTHILQSLVYTFEKDPNKVREYAQQLTDGVVNHELIAQAAAVNPYEKEKLTELIQRWKKRMDYQEGGTTQAPKFPLPNNYLFLLNYANYFQDESIQHYVTQSLHKMAMGGIYDQLGGGFARYSVDMLWKVPHFEKMLYDNGQLLELYAHAYKQNPLPLYHQTIASITAWLENDMLDKNGGFYAAIDADSEGEEGKFYCWTLDEIKRHLDPDEEWILSYYNFNQRGFWEEKKYILLRTETDAAFCKRMGLDKVIFEQKREDIHQKLLSMRNQRIRPVTDKKQLCSWNALTLSGLVRAFEATQTEELERLTKKNYRFIKNTFLQPNGSLLRNHQNGKTGTAGFLDDYAFTIKAFIDYYQLFLDEEALDLAEKLTQYTLQHFQHPESWMFYYSEEDEHLLTRKMDLNDNVLPSSNSEMAKNLYKLSILLKNEKYMAFSEQMLSNITDGMEMYGSGYSNWADLYLFFLHPPKEIGIHGPQAETYTRELKSKFLPDVINFGSCDAKSDRFSGQHKKGKTLIYKCVDKTCDLPVENLNELEQNI